MTEKAPDTGHTDPSFARFDVEALYLTQSRNPSQYTRRGSPWQRHYELGRQHPNQWMLASRITVGGCKARRAVIKRDREKIQSWLARNHPLERWQLRQIHLPDTHCDLELYIRFLGELTEEEHLLDLKRRRERYDAIQAKAAENRAIRQLKARQLAAAAAEKERRAIRGRRRPGE